MTKEEFNRLKTEWEKDTRHLSSITETCTHRAYQRIIGGGKESLPFIYEDLKEGTDHWFWALQSITGDNPVPKEALGRMEQMRTIWLHHLKENGYVQ
jgi:hypothetical protein